jgi:phage anti-repressor protein
MDKVNTSFQTKIKEKNENYIQNSNNYFVGINHTGWVSVSGQLFIA